jgi:hypothetical protein
MERCNWLASRRESAKGSFGAACQTRRRRLQQTKILRALFYCAPRQPSRLSLSLSLSLSQCARERVCLPLFPQINNSGIDKIVSHAKRSCSRRFKSLLGVLFFAPRGLFSRRRGSAIPPLVPPLMYTHIYVCVFLHHSLQIRAPQAPVPDFCRLPIKSVMMIITKTPLREAIRGDCECSLLRCV